MRTQRTNREAGAVLIAVMWGVFVLTAMAFALTTLVRTGSEELRARKEQLQAHYVARGALYKAIITIKAAETRASNEAQVFVAGQRALAWTEDGVQVTVDVMDEGGKLDVNAANQETLERLFQNLDMDFQSARSLAAAIEDWRDPDSDTRLGGAEDGYYTMLPQPYHAANADFRSIEELLLVRGVTPDIFYGRYVIGANGSVLRRLGLVDCLTVHSHASAVNINYAPLPVLLALPGMDPRFAGYIIEGREKKPFRSVSDFTHDYPVLLSGETLGYLSVGTSGRYSLTASGTTPSGITARVRTTVQVGGFIAPTKQERRPDGRVETVQQRYQGPPFVILGWEDSYVR